MFRPCENRAALYGFLVLCAAHSSISCKSNVELLTGTRESRGSTDSSAPGSDDKDPSGDDRSNTEEVETPSKDSASIRFEFESSHVSGDPEIVAGQSHTIKWSDHDEPSEATIDLYADPSGDGSSCSGHVISKGLAVNDKANEFIWETTVDDGGTYTLCAVVTSGGQVEFFWASYRISIDDSFCALHEEESLSELGAGTEGDPIRICTADQLSHLGEQPSLFDKHFLLMNDLDLGEFDDADFTLIGTATDPFTGVFDGNDHVISRFHYIDSEKDEVGMFSNVAEDGEIKNLIWRDATVEGNIYVGSLVGNGTGTMKIQNVVAENVAVNGVAYVGGLAGRAGSVKNVEAHVKVTATGGEGATRFGGIVGNSGGGLDEVDVTGTVDAEGMDYVGGLVGLTSSQIKNVSSSVDVSGRDDVGGVGGSCGHVKNSESTAVVSGRTAVGGVCGSGHSVKRSSASGEVKTTGNYAGGLVGKAETIAGSKSSATVEGVDYVGGLAGRAGSILLSNANATVGGRNYIGGLVGNAYAPYSVVKWTFSSSSIDEATGDFVGGLVGTNAGTIHQSFVASSLPISVSVTNRGGLVGENESGGTITASVWDEDATGLALMCGADSGSGCDDTRGYSTETMKSLSMYTALNWDFYDEADGPHDIWFLKSGRYPDFTFNRSPLPTYESRFSAGDGSSDDPFVISSAAELNGIGHNPLLMEKSFRLANDIDLTGVPMTLIGEPSIPFAGAMNGAGYDLSNMTIDKSSQDYVGLIRKLGSSALELDSVSEKQIVNLSLSGCTVKGNSFVSCLVASSAEPFGLEGVSIDGTVTASSTSSAYAGLVVGSLSASVKAEDVTSSGSVDSDGDFSGGMFGVVKMAELSNSQNNATLTIGGDASEVGGVAGSMRNSTLDGVVNLGDVTNGSGGVYTGGLAGEAVGNTLINAANSGNISGGSTTGGIFGESTLNTLDQVHSVADISGTYNVGGLIGTADWGEAIRNSYAEGTVTATGSVGGLVGYGEDVDLLEYSYSLADVTGSGSGVGGLVGRVTLREDQAIRDSYARGSVKVADNSGSGMTIGGLVGEMAPLFSVDTYTLENCYFGGGVTLGSGNSGDLGGAVGRFVEDDNTITVDGIFWDESMNSGLADVGQYDDGSVSSDYDHLGIAAESSANMTDSDTAVYANAGWDFTEIWNEDSSNENDGYPILRLPISSSDE